MQVRYVDLAAQWTDIRSRALPEIDKVLSSGMYLEHEVVSTLEERLAAFLKVRNVVCLNSGTDALLMALKVLDVKPEDEVITVPNSFIASVAAIEHVGAKSVFVDVGDDHLIDTSKIEKSITSKTKAIMPVHLEGKVANLNRIHEIAQAYGLKVIEDSAQAIGSNSQGIGPGQISDIACFSLHPLKNLNGAGDGGFVATNDDELAARIIRLRSHGQSTRNRSPEFGFVSRLDSIQAAILNIKLDDLPTVINKRREIAAIYDQAFGESSIKIPVTMPGVFHTYHLYVVELENRDKIQERLSQEGIETKIHYPTLITDQEAFTKVYPQVKLEIPNARRQVSRILSLPVHQHLTSEQVHHVFNTLGRLL
jgi:dTDP-4-amino-4,6-dideoxygalactose transaminase